MNLTLIDQRIAEATTETEAAQWREIRDAAEHCAVAQVDASIKGINRMELLREARLLRFSAELNHNPELVEKLDPHMAWMDEVAVTTSQEWMHFAEKTMHIALKHGLWVDPFADIGFPAGRWCETMDRPAARCGCPDCGSSLVQEVQP